MNRDYDYRSMFLRNYSNHLLQEGYKVVSEIVGEPSSINIEGFTPDIYACDGRLQRIIIVKNADEYIVDSPENVALKRYCQETLGASFWGFAIVETGEWRLEENIR